MFLKSESFISDSKISSQDNVIKFLNRNKKPSLRKTKSFSEFSLRRNFKSYCTETSLHGYRYLTKSDISVSEHFFWYFTVFIAMTVCFILVWLSYNWSRGVPTVTVIESTHFSIMNVPFPAVTFCNINRISKRKAYAVAETLIKPSNVTIEELAKLFSLALHFSGNSVSESSNYLALGKILDANHLTALQLLQLLVPTCAEMLVDCSWKGNKVQCNEIFQDVNSTDGFCCAFNYHGLTSTNFGKPYHVSSCGYHTGLTVTLNPDIHDFYGSYLSSYGFRALLHNSYDYPDLNAETKVLPLNTESFISILPQSFHTPQEVAKLKPDVRNCLFGYERKMKVMQQYSFINCMAECRAMYTYELCGCIPITYLNNGSYPSCKMDKIFCIIENINIYTGAIPGLNKTILRYFNFEKLPCDCLPDCEMNIYPAEIAAAELTWPDAPGNIKKAARIRNKVIAHVYFSDLVSTRYRKDIFQNWIKLLATIGGLSGLVMGFSILTGFELIYYMLIRPIFDILTKKGGSL